MNRNVILIKKVRKQQFFACDISLHQIIHQIINCRKQRKQQHLQLQDSISFEICFGPRNISKGLSS